MLVLSKHLFGFAKTTHVYQSEYLELVARVVLVPAEFCHKDSAVCGVWSVWSVECVMYLM